MEIRPILSALLRSKTGAILVALQVSISLAILANALHIVNVRQAVAARPSGIAHEEEIVHIGVRHLVKLDSNATDARLLAELDALRAVAGVTSVAFTSQVPLSLSGGTTGVAADRKQLAPATGVSYYTGGAALARTWGLTLVEGRDYRPDEVLNVATDAQEDDVSKVVLVSRAAAAMIWPGAASVVGKTLYMGKGEDARATQVIGVIDHLQTQEGELGTDGESSIIMPMYRTNGPSSFIFAIRAEPGQRERVTREAESALRKANGAGNPIILRVKSMDDTRKDRYRADVALSWMLVTVSVLLLIITASGIVGMASLWVIQRRKQIGVRRALGARKVDILRYFITENVMITSFGVVAGVMLALGLNQLLVSQLHMARLPLEYLVAGAVVFWALGIAAVYGPAWRAASTSPAMATRST